MKSRLLIVGGFLGAGKTTSLKHFSEILVKQGQRVGLITNDQASELVDTAILFGSGNDIEEVSGSCFCCNFDGFMSAVKLLAGKGADFIVAEPVGSCTDLSATLMQPIKKLFSDEITLMPLITLVDPKRIDDFINTKPSGFHPGADYILRKQLEEADMIVLNKADTLDPSKIERMLMSVKMKFPQKYVHVVSALTGDGFTGLLTSCYEAGDAGKTITEVDYDLYAEGEAVLGWLNATFFLKSQEIDFDRFIQTLMSNLAQKYGNYGFPIAHVKLILENGIATARANLTGNFETLSIYGKAGRGRSAKLILNARVQAGPDQVKKLALEALHETANHSVEYNITRLNSLSPGRPNPTYRFSSVI